MEEDEALAIDGSYDRLGKDVSRIHVSYTQEVGIYQDHAPLSASRWFWWSCVGSTGRPTILAEKWIEQVRSMFWYGIAGV